MKCVNCKSTKKVKKVPAFQNVGPMCEECRIDKVCTCDKCDSSVQEKAYWRAWDFDHPDYVTLCVMCFKHLPEGQKL